jgi:hypothetical protein
MLGLAALGGATAAHAQVGGGAPNGQVNGAAADAPNGGDLNGGLGNPGRTDGDQTDLKTSKPMPPQRRTPYFDRVKTVRREVVPLPAPRGAQPGGTSAASGPKPEANPLRPHNAQAMQALKSAVDPHVSASSSWHQESTRPTPARSAVRSTTNNYYPALRPGRATNSNAAQSANAGRGRTRSPFGLLLVPGAGQTNAAGKVNAARNANAAGNAKMLAPARAPSVSIPARRR